MINKLSTLVVVLILFGIGLNAQETRINQYGQEVTATPLETEAQDGFIKWFSKDGNYKMWMDNRAQLDGYMFGSDGLNALGNGITIRRMRFAIKAEFWKNWYGEIDLDFESSGTEIKDAYLKYTPDSKKWNLKAGHFKEGYGMETTTTSRYLLFMERSFASTLDPSRHLGLQANIFANKFLFVGGVHFNTVGDAEEVELTSGRGPAGIAAAALYVAALMNDEKKTQREVADIAGITEVTIRNRYKELIERLNLEEEIKQKEIESKKKH